MGDIKYGYETQLLESLCLESPYPGPKITELWVEWVIHSELVADVVPKKKKLCSAKERLNNEDLYMILVKLLVS